LETTNLLLYDLNPDIRLVLHSLLTRTAEAFHIISPEAEERRRAMIAAMNEENNMDDGNMNGYEGGGGGGSSVGGGEG